MTLFVCNIRFELTDQDLYQLFSPYGSIKAATIALHSKGDTSRGFGFVQFSNPVEAKAAIQALNGYAWHGRTITVQEAKALPNRRRAQELY